MVHFPDDFLWGVSTSAYQIEGAQGIGGKGESIWDRFSAAPGRIAGGHSGEVACDHYHRYAEDVALMAALGVGAYRFSTAWTRWFPTGSGRPNRAGRDFYERLVDALLARGIDPWLCLFHWDLPQALQDRGGWASRDTAFYFRDYAAHVADHLGDRVRCFLMMNEPGTIALQGHLLGTHAPGLTDPDAFFAATHHLNLATGLALSALRERNPSWKLGTVLSLEPVDPSLAGEEHDRAAALLDTVCNRNFLDPLFEGRYPGPTQAFLEPLLQPGDLEQIRQPLDFLGVNHYTRLLAQADPGSPFGVKQADPPARAERTDMGWEVHPASFRRVLLELRERYGNPVVYVTENGAAFPESPGPDGRVHDARRIAYLRGYLAALHDAREAGADIRGYFVWSLLDNFEWAEGFYKRFGLVHVDFTSQKRTPKTSFNVYAELIRTGVLAQAP